MDIETRLDKIGDQLSEMNINMRVLSSTHSALSSTVVELNNIVRQHEKRFTILDAEKCQKSVFIAFLSRNWFTMIVFLAAMGDFLHQFKDMRA